MSEMQINLHKIEYKNIREMTDLCIDLCGSGKPKHISLIQMPNGIGKTTTMELIRYCLDAEKGKDALNEKKILSFKPPSLDVSTGQFTLTLSIDGELKVIKLKLDYTNASVKITTSSTASGGEVDGIKLGLEIEPWLRANFIRLFIFDGELAGELLKSESTSAEEAIRALYHLDNLIDFYEDGKKIDVMIDDKMSGNIQTERASKAEKTRLSNARRQKKYLETELSNFESNLEAINTQIDKATSKIEEYRKQDDRYIKAYQDIINKNTILESEVKELTGKLLISMRSPHNVLPIFFKDLLSFSNQMTKLKLPKTQSVEFFNELAEAPFCVCGRSIGPEEKRIIKEGAKNYLTEDNIGEINSIKSSIRNLPERTDIGAYIEEIKQKNRMIKLNERRKSRLDRKTKNKDAIVGLNTKLSEYNIDKNEYENGINILTENRKEEQELFAWNWETNIPLCEKKITELEAQVIMTDADLIFKNKGMLLKQIMREINDRSLDILKEDILNETNQKIRKILKTDEIIISHIGNYLSLHDRAGVSEGQKLSIAYSFLSTLFSQSPHKIPFVVDTPAAPLDLSVRREVADTLPALFNQIVVFITSGERDGFADQYYGKKNCQFLTVGKREGAIMLNTNLKYFKTFQSEE